MPAAVPTYSSGPAAGSAAPPAPAVPAAAPAFPAATAAPAVPAVPEQPVNLEQLKPKDLVKGLPLQAQGDYLRARARAEKAREMMPLHTWLSMWRNSPQLRDPYKTLIELDIVKLLTQMQPPPSSSRQPAGQRSVREGYLREAQGMIMAIQNRRVSDPALVELISKAEADIDNTLQTLR
jgi:hypothetical protein